jgi:quercetin dioxygenase-like cupin family protein
LPELKPGSYELNLTRVTFPPGMPSNLPHHRSGAALYYIVSGIGANTVDGKTADRGPGSLIYEPFGLVHQWGNPGSEPLTFLAFNINLEGVPAVIPETPPSHSGRASGLAWTRARQLSSTPGSIRGNPLRRKPGPPPRNPPP